MNPTALMLPHPGLAQAFGPVSARLAMRPADVPHAFMSPQFGSYYGSKDHPLQHLGWKTVISGSMASLLTLLGLVGNEAVHSPKLPVAVRNSANQIQHSVLDLRDEETTRETGKTSALLRTELEAHYRSLAMMFLDQPDLKAALNQLDLDEADMTVLRGITDEVETASQKSSSEAVKVARAHYGVFADKILSRHLSSEQVTQYKAAGDTILANLKEESNVANSLFLVLMASLSLAAVGGGGMCALGKRLRKDF